MICEHLIDLEQALVARGFRETFRGEAWAKNTREWIYFNVCLDMAAVREQFGFAPCVIDNIFLGTHDGQEAGFECTEHLDGVMGVHPQYCRGVPVFP